MRAAAGRLPRSKGERLCFVTLPLCGNQLLLDAFTSRAAASSAAALSAAAVVAPLPLPVNGLAAFAAAPLAPAPSPSAVAAAGGFISFFISFNATLLMCMLTKTALFDGFGKLITGTGSAASATRTDRPKALQRHVVKTCRHAKVK